MTLENGAVNVAVRVKNTGAVRGKEVVQIYVSVPQGELTKEYQRLSGVQKKDPPPPYPHPLHGAGKNAPLRVRREQYNTVC